MVPTHQTEKAATDVHAERQGADRTPAESTPRLDPDQRLRRSLGNSFVQRLALLREPTRECTGGAGCSCANCARHVQAKLEVGAANDPCEQEADQVADQVLRMPDRSAQVVPGVSAPSVTIRRRASNYSASASEANIDVSQAGGQPLSAATRAYMEPRFGVDFSHVNLHADEPASRAASAIQARAFTYSNHIWLGKGESEQDKHLMAHELTHVVQQSNGLLARDQGGSANAAGGDAKIRREPTAAQCPDGQKTVTVDMVSLRGSSRDAPADLSFANSVFRSCCVNLQMGKGLSVIPSLSDKWLGGDTIMNRATARGAIDAEQSTTYDQATATFGLSSRIRAFYVDDMNPSVALATSFPAVWATGVAAPYEGMVIVTNAAASRSLAHEIGHILLNADGAVHTGHPGGTSNLMEPTATATGETLEPTQCATIFANA